MEGWSFFDADGDLVVVGCLNPDDYKIESRGDYDVIMLLSPNRGSSERLVVDEYVVHRRIPRSPNDKKDSENADVEMSRLELLEKNHKILQEIAMAFGSRED